MLEPKKPGGEDDTNDAKGKDWAEKEKDGKSDKGGVDPDKYEK